MTSRRTLVVGLLALVVGFLLVRWLGREEPPTTMEGRALALLQELQREVEEGRVGAVYRHLDPRFQDDHGNDRETVRGALAAQLLGQAPVQVLAHHTRARLQGDGEVQLQTRLSLLRQGRTLPLFTSGEGLELTLDLAEREGELVVVHAQWRRVPLLGGS